MLSKTATPIAYRLKNEIAGFQKDWGGIDFKPDEYKDYREKVQEKAADFLFNIKNTLSDKKYLQNLVADRHIKNKPLLGAMEFIRIKLFEQINSLHLNFIKGWSEIGLDGAFTNAIAASFGLILVLAKKFRPPSKDASQEQWDTYQKDFFKLAKKNLSLLRDMSHFHSDIQSLFYNLNGIYSKVDHSVYKFKPENFKLTGEPTEEKTSLTITDKHIQEIIDQANEPDTMVENGNRTHGIRFMTSIEGCPIVDLMIEEFGNYYNKICLWLIDALEKIIEPHFKEIMSEPT